MSLFGRGRGCRFGNIRGRIRAELCRIDIRCVIAGAVIVMLSGFLSALAGGSADAYGELELPAGAPPGFVFVIVWTVLYIVIGGAAGAVACCPDRSCEQDKYKGLLFFIIMMVFNFIWYPLFFGAEAYFSAFMAIIMMIVMSFFAMCHFFRIYVVCGAAMAVYLAWLFYAAYLNLAVLFLN